MDSVKGKRCGQLEDEPQSKASAGTWELEELIPAQKERVAWAKSEMMPSFGRV